MYQTKRKIGIQAPTTKFLTSFTPPCIASCTAILSLANEQQNFAVQSRLISAHIVKQSITAVERLLAGAGVVRGSHAAILSLPPSVSYLKNSRGCPQTSKFRLTAKLLALSAT